MSKHKHNVVLGAGPLGRAIANQLVMQGQTVTVVTRDGREIADGIRSAKADLSDAAETIAVGEGAATIFQCAAPPYHKWAEAFPAIQDAAIAAAEASGAVLVAVENLYGYGVAGTLTEEFPLAADTRKGSVRARLSQDLLEAHAAGRAKCVAGRATDFFGPDVHMSALGERFWPALLAGKTIDWVGDPDVKHSFAYLPDLAAAYVALAQTPTTWGRAWHLPAMPPITVRQLCELLSSNGGSAPKIRKTPSWLLKTIGLFEPAVGELVEMRYMFDNPFIIDHSKLDQELTVEGHGWNAALTETLAWWKTQTS